MEIQLKKEVGTINQTVANLTSQARAETDIIVPDVKPDIAKIIQIDARAVIMEKNLMSDKLNLEGKVDLNIIYISDYQQIRNIVTSCRFTHSMDHKGLTSDMLMQVDCEAQPPDFYLLNSRKINVQIPVEIDARITKQITLEVATELDNPNFEVLRGNIQFNSLIHQAYYPITIKSNIELQTSKPSIDEIIKMDIMPSVSEVNPVNDGIKISGSLGLNIVYLSDIAENNLQMYDSNIPFSEVIEINEPCDNVKYDVDYSIKDLAYILKENNDGETKIIILQLVLEVGLRIIQNQTIMVLNDVYCTTNEVTTESSEIELEEMCNHSEKDIAIKETLDIPEGAPKIRQICSINPRTEINSTQWKDNNLIINGVIRLQTLYISDNQEVMIYSCKNEIPFCEELSMENRSTGNAFYDIDAKVDVLGCEVTCDTKFNMKLNLELSAKIIGTNKIEYIKTVSMTEQPISKLDNYCIRVYFTKPGDTLWSISKKYKVKMDVIRKINELTGEIEPNTRILLA